MQRLRMKVCFSGRRIVPGIFAVLAGGGVLLGWLVPAGAVAQEIGNQGGEATPGAGVQEATAGMDEAVIPRAYSFEDRYRDIGEESPFMLDATPDQLIVESPFRDLAVSSVYESPKGIRVKVINVKTKTPYYVTEDPSNNALGLKVVNIESDPNPRNVKVLIEANGEQGTVTFDDSLVSAAATGPAAAPANRAIPNAQQQNRPTLPASLTPRSDGTPSGRRRIVLPRPVARPTAPPAGGQGATPATTKAAGQAQQVLQKAPAANPPSRWGGFEGSVLSVKF
jgi:hypothetical protein